MIIKDKVSEKDIEPSFRQLLDVEIIVLWGDLNFTSSFTET